MEGLQMLLDGFWGMVDILEMKAFLLSDFHLRPRILNTPYHPKRPSPEYIHRFRVSLRIAVEKSAATIALRSLPSPHKPRISS
jgi:hypothetical protein